VVRLFIACLATETNSFSPIPTGISAFRESMLYFGDATVHPPELFSAPLLVWRRRAEAAGFEVVESVCAFAQPGGLVPRQVYESLRDRILSDLKAAMPVDLVLLNLHGAMIADGYEDCEGDLLGRVRELVGPGIVVGAELDLHANLSAAMLRQATFLLTYKEYPHTDIGERAEEVFAIGKAAIEGRCSPVMAATDCRMLGQWRTSAPPIDVFVARLKSLERPPILSVSFVHGFPWGDVADVGATMLAVADGDPPAAESLCRSLANELWQMRETARPAYLSIEEALDGVAAATAGPLVLADTSDNAGGGAASDSTFLLQAIIDRGLRDVAVGLLWDPVAVRLCCEAGEGAQLALRVGGKCSRNSGAPVDLEVTVRRCIPSAWQSFGGTKVPVGDLCWASSDRGIDVVLNTIRTQTFHPDAFTQLGLDLGLRRAVVVKSMQHFVAGFAPIAAGIRYVATPGSLAPDFANIPLTRRRVPYWPRVANPFA
jgi:microcystin degradation protein MlrC